MSEYMVNEDILRVYVDLSNRFLATVSRSAWEIVGEDINKWK